jgi:drug/metabolite transporter (DMT)-like permease
MVMFLHESISMVQMVGVVLIVGGIIVANQG